MRGAELFDSWAPPEAVWSEWVKPLLFAEWDDRRPAAPPPTSPPLPEPPLGQDPGTAAIVDLPGDHAVLAGIALARRGYRPVPLFNGAHHPSAILDVAPIMDGLARGAEELRRLRLAPEAPPAFLLDARRTAPVAAEPGRFDNRWLAFPQDFPSAALLASRGIRRVALIAEPGKEVAADLAHVLLRYKQGGLELAAVDPSGSGLPRPLEVKEPPLYRALFHRALAALGLRRNAAGGFGAIVPLAGAGGGLG